MTRILFVCLGNICRSPMAEFVMKQLVEDAGVADQFEISSAGTSAEELGNGVYPPVRRLLLHHGIDPSGKTARKMTKADYARYDLLLGMDSANIRNMVHICGGDPERKIARLLDFTDRPRDISDPWYTRDFEQTWSDVREGCQALLKQLREKGKQFFDNRQ